ncbi:MAG: hypothetical protein J6P45_00675 [Lachnospiraceae bacterium]|nr:hypothetical protein [Lachnospiraceae bacterium]MBR1876446.1 hypothetical protein [Lachnospiraceae bacterium]
MDDLYVECLVAKKSSPVSALIKGLVYGVTAVAVLGGLFINPLLLVVAVAGGAAIYFALPMLSVEYEYLYVSKSLTVDKIFSKEKRKNAAEYDLEKMEIFAEEGAYQLDEYKNLQTVKKDYTSADPGKDRWIMVVRNGNTVEEIYLEPNEEMINAIKNHFPRKTFYK